MDKKKVVVGLSGGVDSSVAAYLLKEQGYDVIGVTMQTWQENNSDKDICSGGSAVIDAGRIAEKLDIPYHVVNFEKEFKKKVMDYFINEYLNGRTPNPCTVCNRYVKWEALIDKGLEMGADYIATGHYARIDMLENGRYAIRMAQSSYKDQTYALYNLTQEQLARTIMPVGQYTKDEIRQIAAKLDLEIANKPDSQDICFVPDGDYASFIEKSTGVKTEQGNFVDVNGNIIGRHKGIIHYTIGQRKGLNLAMGTPVFVKAIRPETNEVVIGDASQIMSDTVYVDNVNCMGLADFDKEVRLIGKIRYAHKGAWCTVKMQESGLLKCVFDEPQRAVTPGQALVLYDGEYVMGGGTII